MARKRYPIGIQTFERIRKEDWFYVDKTEYIYRMTHTDGTYFFLSRPRRFGKSLLVSTFESYFEGKKELFNGLAIEKLEKEWNEYPVLHFSLAGGKHMEKEQLEHYLLFILKTNEEKFGITCDSPDPNIRMLNLIQTVYEKTGKQPVVLIDEYDAPLLDVVHEGTSLDILRNMLSPLSTSAKRWKQARMTLMLLQRRRPPSCLCSTRVDTSPSRITMRTPNYTPSPFLTRKSESAYTEVFSLTTWLPRRLWAIQPSPRCPS